MVSDISRTLPQFAAIGSNQPPQESPSVNPAAPPRDNAPTLVDTVNISDQSRQAGGSIKAEQAQSDESKKQSVKREETNKAFNSAKSAGSTAKVQFVYNQKGDLSIRYMDNANRLIYQVPSELMLRLKEAAAKSASSVDTKV